MCVCVSLYVCVSVCVCVSVSVCLSVCLSVSLYMAAGLDRAVKRDFALCIRAGTDHCMLLTRGGEMYSWGTGRQGQLGRVGERHLERDDKVLCVVWLTIAALHLPSSPHLFMENKALYAEACWRAATRSCSDPMGCWM